MKAVILAAGRGTRISRMIKEIPKSLLPVEGVPLIRRTVEMLIEKKIKPVVCVGYEKERIYEALEGLDVTYYSNPFFDVTNSIATLWFAKEELNEDVLIMNADVYFEEELLDKALQSSKPCSLLVDPSRTAIGDYFLKTENGNIIAYGKELPIEERTCEYVGIGKISKEFLPVFKKSLNTLIDGQKHNLWWENVLYELTSEYNIETIDTENLFWAEIDYFDDYERILEFIKINR